GVVYEAVDEALGRPVAIKVLRRDIPLPELGQRRFAPQARALPRLDHPPILPGDRVGRGGAPPYLGIRLIGGGGPAAAPRPGGRVTGPIGTTQRSSPGSASRSPRRWPTHMPRASFTATSSRRTS